jgi:uncharacterized membrane protein
MLYVVPGANVLTLSDALPLASATLPSWVVPLLKVTEPVGVPVEADTLAVSVTAVLAGAGFVEALSVVAVAMDIGGVGVEEPVLFAPPHPTMVRLTKVSVPSSTAR